MSRFPACLLACAFGGFGLAPAARAFAIYTVGGDAACGYSSIQAAIDAAAANPGEDYVWIAGNQAYTGQHVVVADQDVDIEGGFTDCSDVDPETALTTVSGAGNGGGAVFAIRGTSHVLLANLFVRDADRGSNGDGGGVDFVGAGGLTLQRTTVSLNSADYGAGINVRGAGAGAVLTLGSDTLVLNNTAAVSGGGIRIEGNARLIATAPQTLIGYNHALGGYGGGIEVLGPARADIGSPGYNGSAVLQFNEAAYGGAIAAAAIGEDKDAVVRVFTTDADNPVQISNNTATATGGGVYLQPYFSGAASYGDAWLCAFDFRIEGNIAQEGAAIYADLATNFVNEYTGTTAFLNSARDSAYCGEPETIGSLGAVACAAGMPCNVFAGNIAENEPGESSGAIVLMQSGGWLQADRFRMHGNRGRHAIRTVADESFVGGGYAYVSLHDCLIADNEAAASLILQTPGDDLSILQVHGCTIARNAIGGAVLEVGSTDTELTHTIVDQPGVATVAIGDGSLIAAHVLSNDIGTLPPGDGVVQGTPSFVDAAGGDYHLAPASFGIDAAPATTDAFDLDGRSRNVDLPGAPNAFGAQDLGAFEAQLDCASADTIFCNGFEP